MSELRFTQEHEWIRVEDGIGTVGISDYAQAQLGDVVFVELPALGRQVSKGGEAAVVESVKAASEVYSPVDGTVVGINDALNGQPGIVNDSAEGEGWFFRVRLAEGASLDGLMDRAAYDDFVKAL